MTCEQCNNSDCDSLMQLQAQLVTVHTSTCTGVMHSLRNDYDSGCVVSMLMATHAMVIATLLEGCGGDSESFVEQCRQLIVQNIKENTEASFPTEGQVIH